MITEKERELADLLEWEGWEYALTDMRPENMPTKEGKELLQKAQEGMPELYSYFNRICNEAFS